MRKVGGMVNYRLDRQFKEVGRIVVNSGVATAREFQARNELLSRLHRTGRFQILRAIQGGHMTVTEVYAADREDRLDLLSGDRAVMAQALWPAVDAWLKTRSGSTARRYKCTFNVLKGAGVLSETAPVAALEHVDWKALRPSWAPSAASWNHLRRTISVFLTETLGDLDHPFRKAVRKAFGKMEKEVHRVPDITPELFWKVVRKAPEHARGCFVTLVATGLRVGEYLRLEETDLLPHTCSVRVPGTKTAASAATVRVDEQLWPWVQASVPSPLRYKWLMKYWKRALEAASADTTLRLHDLRHCHGQWAVNVGVSEAAVQASLRHTNRAMTARYTAQHDRGTVAGALAHVLLGSNPSRSHSKKRKKA